MREELFAKLVESVRDGGAILRGERTPSRAFEVKSPEAQAIREDSLRPFLESVPLRWGWGGGLEQTPGEI